MKLFVLSFCSIFCLSYQSFSQKKIREELSVPGHNLYVNEVNAAHQEYPRITGKNIVISVKENNFDNQDIDFKGRFLFNNRSNVSLTSHANIMATLIAGAGNSSSTGKGVAFGSQLVSTGFNNLFPEPVTYFDSFKITVQNHSYGFGIENFYGAEALAYDKLVVSRPNTIIIFSSGNFGIQTPKDGKYANIPQVANLTGNFKEAKNILVVGSVDSFGVSESFSSRGPAYDGRLKPDLVAFGNDGTSGAAALVSGSAALLQQSLFEKQNTIFPPASLIKAILINSADDVGAQGIDFITGYGNLNLIRALQTVENNRFFEASLENGKKWSTILNIPKNIENLKLTLVWTDTAFASNDFKALVNDLDFELENTQTGEIILPWVLNSAPNPDSLSQLSKRKRDTLNNIEQISLSNSTPGNYIIRVIGSKVLNTQIFHIAYQFDTLNYFNWTFPKRNDNIASGENLVLRWNTNIKDTKTILKYKNINSKIWSIVDSFKNIESLYKRWRSTNYLELGQFAVDVANQSFISDTFFVSQDPQLKIAFDCNDSVGLIWNKLSDSSTYQIFTLGDKYLEAVKTTSDTFFVFNKLEYLTRYFTVASKLKNFIGIKSPTPDYFRQGVACYTETFYANHLTDNTVGLNWTIRTTYNLKKIILERYENGKFRLFKEIPISGLVYSQIDTDPLNGINYYRLHFETYSGQIFYSEEINVLILKETNYVIFPNPTYINTALTIISKEENQNVHLIVFNIWGQVVLEKYLNDYAEYLNLPSNLAKGMYFYKIEKLGKIFASGNVVILE